MRLFRQYLSVGKSFVFLVLIPAWWHSISGQVTPVPGVPGAYWADTGVPIAPPLFSMESTYGVGMAFSSARPRAKFPADEELSKGVVAYRNISQAEHLKLAVEWFQAAAARGNPIAKMDLAIMHFNHEGGLESRASGLALLEEASGRYAPASIILARIFATRGNPEFNPDSALRVARRAANQDEATGAFFLGELLRTNLRGKQNMNYAIIAYRRSMSAGSLQAAWQLGEIYRGGLGVPVDTGKALGYFTTAAKQRYPAAQISLGLMFAAGAGAKPDLPRAAALWKDAADWESQDGRYLYGLLLLEGRDSIKAQPDEAVRYLRLAAVSGHAGARATLGTYLVAHPELDTGHQEAFRWLTLALEGGAAKMAEPLAALKAAMSPEEIHSLEIDLADWRKTSGTTTANDDGTMKTAH